MEMNVKEYRKKYTADFPDLEKMTDYEISEAVYNQQLKEGKLGEDLTFDKFQDGFLIERPDDNIALYRKEFEPKYPELKEMSDLEIADRLYDFKTSQGAELEYKKFINQFAPKGYGQEDDSETLDQYKFISPDDDMNTIGAPTEYTVEEIAKVTGVQQPSGEVFDKTKEALRAGSYAVDEENKALGYKNVLSKLYGQDIDIRLGPKTGEFEFYNPKTKSYTLINKPGLDVGDFYGLEGDAIVIAPEILGNVLGIPGGPAGVIFTGAGGAAIGEYIRLKAGQNLYGINKDLSNMDLLKESGETGALTAALGSAGIGLPKLFKLVDNYLSGRMSATDLEPFVKNAEEAKRAADEINLRLEKAGYEKNLKFNLAQASDDPDLLAVQAKFEAMPKTKMGAKFNDFNQEQAEILNNYFNIINKNPYNVKGTLFGPDSNITKNEVGQRIQQIAKERAAPGNKELIDLQANSLDDLTNEVITLPNGQVKPMGTRIKSLIEAADDDVSKKFQEEYDKLFELGAGKTIKQDKLIAALDEISDQEKKNLFKKLPKIKDFIQPKMQKQKKVITGPDGKPVEVEVEVPAGEISLEEAKNTISALKQWERNISKGVEAAPIEGALSKVRNAINDSISDLGPDDPWAKEYFRISTDYRAAKDKFRSVLGDIVEKRNGRVLIADEDVFNTTFKRGKAQQDRIDKTYEILSGDPEALDLYRDNILAFYGREVADAAGNVSPVKHANFMKNYDYALKKFFNVDDAGFKKLEKIGELAKKADNIKKNKSQMFKQLNDSLDVKLSDMHPDNIFNALYGPEKIGKLRDGLKIIKKDPELFKAFQSVAKDELEKGIKKRGVFDFNKFDDYLSNNEKNLELVFGKEYVKDLNVLKNGIKIASRKGKVKKEDIPIVNGIIRAQVGLFTRAGRFLTAGQRLAKRNSDRLIGEMILNPDKIKEYVKLTKVNPKSQAALGILSQLGATEFFALPGDPTKRDLSVIRNKGVKVDQLPSIDIERAPMNIIPGIVPQEKPEEMQQQSAVPQPQQPQGIAALPSQPAPTQQTTDRGQQYAGLFPQDPLGQAIART